MKHMTIEHKKESRFLFIFAAFFVGVSLLSWYNYINLPANVLEEPPFKWGFGTVIKAAGSGELAGVGKLGVAGKTVCKDCNVRDQCKRHPRMIELLSEYQKPYEKRDYDKIAAIAGENAGKTQRH